jgi:hypothetical protein
LIAVGHTVSIFWITNFNRKIFKVWRQTADGVIEEQFYPLSWIIRIIETWDNLRQRRKSTEGRDRKKVRDREGDRERERGRERDR